MIVSPYDWKCLNRYQGYQGTRVYQCRNCGTKVMAESGRLDALCATHYQHRPECQKAALHIPAAFPYRFVLWGGRDKLHRDPPDLKQFRPNCVAEKWPWER
jgi:hypothetical protein